MAQETPDKPLTDASSREHCFFDAHCHLQDARLEGRQQEVLSLASLAGVKWCAVNGTSEEDWGKVRSLCEHHPQLLPNFGLHPWYVSQRSPDWLEILRKHLEDTPEAAVGEVGLDKGKRGSEVPIEEQVEVFKAQVELARDLERPVSIHCVRAFGELQDILRSSGPFPGGVLLHSWMGSAEMVKALAPLNAYFSISGFITGMSSRKADKMLRQIPLDRLLLETDSPDALPDGDLSLLTPLSTQDETSPENSRDEIPGCSCDENSSPNLVGKESTKSGEFFPQSPRKEGPGVERDKGEGGGKEGERLNHPANLRAILQIVADKSGRSVEEVQIAAYENTIRLFSFKGSRLASSQLNSESEG